MWGHVGLLSGLAWQPWLVQYLFMRWGCGDDMTCAKFLPGSCLDGMALHRGHRPWMTEPVEQARLRKEP